MLVRAGLACCGLQKSDVHLIIMNIVVKIVFTRTLLTVSESLTSCWPILRAKIGHKGIDQLWWRPMEQPSFAFKAS